MTRTPLPDEAARLAVATDLDSTMLVEAGAGSGKTASLVKRMVALVVEGRCPVERMAAVTFTRKAASELRERFQIELESAARAARTGETGAAGPRQHRLELALSDLDRCFTGTIHSFCARLLRERPVEAGVDPDFDEIEGAVETHLRNTSWEEHLDGLRFEKGEPILELERLGVTLDDLRQVYERITLFPDVEIVRRPAPAPDTAGVRARTEEFLRWARERLPWIAPPNGWDDAQATVRRCLRVARATDISQPRNLFNLLGMLDRNVRVTQNRWPSRADAIEFGEHLERFREEVAAPALKAWREHRHYPLIGLVLPAAERFAEKRRATAQLNFQDLLMIASAMLREHPHVRSYFQNRITHLLVDEFQDTDPIQAEIMFYLTGTDVEQKDWMKLVPRPGSLFVVGDPKQSIYRFRRADIDTYNTVKDLLSASGGRIVRLTSNFRSVRSIAGWVNSVFGGMLPPAPTQQQAQFAPMDPVREPRPGTVSGVRRMTVPAVYRHNSLDIASIDAEQIAGWLRHAFDATSLSPGDVLILTMRRRHLGVYARALEKYGIPFGTAGGNAFADSKDVREFLKVLRCIAEPDNPVLLVAALRGAYFGVSDRQLYEFSEAGGVFSLLVVQEGSGAAPDAGSGAVVEECVRTLSLLHTLSCHAPPSAVIDTAASELGVIALAASGEMGSSRAGNVLKFIEMARSAESRGYATFREVVAFLDLAVTEGEVDEMSAFPVRRNAVRLMNLHKAKGLEAPVVFLADPAGERDHEPTEHVARGEGGRTAHFTIFRESGRGREVLAVPPGWDELRAREELFQEAERRRLLYVAGTRARDLLVISEYAGKPEASPWNALLEGQDIEELAPAVPPAVVAPAKAWVPLTAPESSGDPAMASRLRREALHRVTIPTYSVIAVTTWVDRARRDLPPGERAPEQATRTAPASVAGPQGPLGVGAAAGRTAHRVLRAIGENEALEADMPAVVRSMAEDGGDEPGAVEGLINLVVPVVRSPLWSRMRNAEMRLFEVPFATRVDAGSPLTVVTGVIDLVFKEADGWVLVDYKTDTGADDRELFQRYAAQVLAYSTLWEDLTRERVKDAYIVRCATGGAVAVPCTHKLDNAWGQ
ncbi:MAG: UvrD-helicase domain-containing protein [Firmicutes bacterium]|nr:UvrD-helicase domain-containing protein [Bacillota bacterium]